MGSVSAPPEIVSKSACSFAWTSATKRALASSCSSLAFSLRNRAVHGVNTFDYHGDFPNGIYVQSGLNRDIFVFVANPPLTVNNVAGQDLRTIYAADGTPIGTLSIHETIHITFQDTNGNGQPDPGEITVQFDHFRLRCG
jgi:hypothetical protein